MNEIYIGNDHRIDIKVRDPFTNKPIIGLAIQGFISENPSGSSATSSWFGPPTTSFQSASFGTQSLSSVTSSGFVESFVQHSSQSILRISSGSNSGIVNLTAPLTESPACSGEYAGVIPGASISTIFSSSFSQSLTTEFSSSVVTGSFSGSFSGSVTLSLSVTMSVTGFTSSLTTSHDIPLSNTPDRCSGIFEIITSGTFFKTSTPMVLRGVRFIP